MGKSEQTGGGGGGTEMTPRKEPKPKQKRPWIKPRLAFIEMDFTRTGGSAFPHSPFEGTYPDAGEPARYRVPTS